MPYAILNEKLCDNYEYCPAKRACEEMAAAAISLNRYGNIIVERNKCIGCSTCIKYCGIFRVVDNLMAELDTRKNEFENNPLTNLDYRLVERFGCGAFDKESHQLLAVTEIDGYINTCGHNSECNILEFVDETNELCPFQGVEVNRVLEQFERPFVYKKYLVQQSEISAIYSKYGLTNLPAILIFHHGHLVGTPIYGRYQVESAKQGDVWVGKMQREFEKRLGGIATNE